MHCKYLKELVSEERNIIERHLEEYKECKHIGNATEAKIKFVEEYGWIMREIFCDLCLENKNCKIYKKLMKKFV